MAYDVFSMNRRNWLPILAAVALNVFNVGNAAADSQAADGQTPKILEISVGFNGQYKTGAWTPVRVRVANAPPRHSTQLVLTTTDDEGIPCRFESYASDQPHLAANGHQTFVGYVCFGRRPAKLDVKLTIDEQSLTSSWHPAREDFVASTQQWILMIGGDFSDGVRHKSLANAARLLDRPRGREVRVVHLTDPTQLPAEWYGMAGFDLVVVSGSQLDVWGGIRPEQWRALEEWTKLGGQLMLCVGDQAEVLLTDESPAAVFLPGEVTERVVIPNTTRLEEFAGAADRLDVILQSGRWPDSWRTSTGQGGLPIAWMRQPAGRIIAAESFGGETVPLVVRNLHGLGHAIFVAFDLDSEPLKQWSGYNKLMLQLLRLSVDQRSGEQVESTGGRVSHLGFSDISGQLRTALQQFPGVRLVPFAWIGVLAALYVVLIGPVDYFFLRKLPEKMHWTWFSFPITALAVCGLSLLLVHHWKGTTPRLNQVDLIDWDAASGVVRGTNWTHFFSPVAKAFDCQIRFDDSLGKLSESAQTLTIWDGLPGQSFGGMDVSSPLQSHNHPYAVRFHDALPAEDPGSRLDVQIDGLRLPIASSRAIRADWWTLAAPAVRSELSQQADTYLSGTIANPFDFDLRDCALLYDRWYYKLGLVEANAAITIDSMTTPSSLKSQLIGRVVQEDSHTIVPWQQTSLNVPRIMEMIMFQRAAGGRSYTGLEHRHHRNRDFTEQLAAGRAVLVGRVQRPLTALNTDEFPADGAQNWAYCRLVLPVSPYAVQATADGAADSSVEVTP